MGDDEQTKTEQGEIIFSARYSVLRVWSMVIVVAMFPTWIFCYLLYIDVVHEKYIHAFFVSVLLLLMLLFTLDSILFKELLFYQDRVVKVWHIFGSRTIYYVAGKIVDPPRYWRWVLSGHHIRETRSGKNFVLQIPVLYIGSMFPSTTARKIETIMDYLTQDVQNNPRNFKKASLELVAKPHKRFMTIMIQAIWMKASYMQTWCSYRTTMRRKFPNQLKVLSTVYRLLYRSQSRSSCRFTFL